METPLEKAFLEALEQYKNKLFRICSSYTGSPDDARDLFQEVVLNLWKAFPSFRQQAQAGTWMYRIALNVCLQAKYKAKRQQQAVVRLDSLHLEHLPDPGTDFETEQKHSRLQHCIQQLNEADRSVMVLFLEDLPYRDIAAITGISENYVAVKVKRIKNNLLTCLSNSSHDGR